MQHLEGSGTPVLYIGRTVLKGPGFPQFMCILTVVADSVSFASLMVLED